MLVIGVFNNKVDGGGDDWGSDVSAGVKFALSFRFAPSLLSINCNFVDRLHVVFSFSSWSIYNTIVSID